MRLNNLLRTLLAVLAFAGTARAQEHAVDSTASPLAAEAPPPPDVVFVTVGTNLPGALLYADTLLVGRATAAPVAVPAQTRQVRLVAPGSDAWSIPPVAAPLAAHPGDTVAVVLDFPYHYHVESVPFGAVVSVERDGTWQRLGETPLHHTSERPLAGTLVVSRPGFAMTRLAPGTRVWNSYSVNLQPEPETDPNAARVAWKPPRPRSSWIDVVAIGTAAAAGALAVHYKFKADRLYDRYAESTDPALRPQIREYDTYSAVSLGVMQAGIGLFALRLALR